MQQTNDSDNFGLFADDADFTFRFQLAPGESESSDQAAVDEYIRTQILSILEVVSFCSKGKKVKIDGFIYHKDNNEVHPLWQVNRASVDR